MRRRIRIATAICLLGAVGVWFFWPHSRIKMAAHGANPKAVPAAVAVKNPSAPGAGKSTAASAAKVSTLNTNKLAYRLSNTTDSIKQLESNPHAILMENAFIDTKKPVNLKIPAQLRSTGDPGAYIVQARGSTGPQFRAMLQAAGAEIVSYIPNNAYLVRLPALGTSALTGNPLVQTVLPYEPYYKLQSSLLGLAVNQQPLPPGMALTLGLFSDDPTAAQEVQNLGAIILGRDQSPFGPVLHVLAPLDWTTLVQSPVVQFAEPSYLRKAANDLSRVTVGVSPDTISPITNGYAVNGYVLTGSNVLVSVNDSGIDVTHPDFTTGGAAEGPAGGPPIRVFGKNPIDMVDTNGHGTHVAGIIAGNGAASYGAAGPVGNGPNVGVYAEGSVSNADFRGKAPFADIFSLAILNNAGYGNGVSDYQIQTNAAVAGALISNNSWVYDDDEYDLVAASYDAATRDALPYTTGSQPVLFVFAAGDSGGGLDDGTQGSADTIGSPGTAKDTITVGALEQFRNITNLVSFISGTGTNTTTNMVAFWQPQTDSANQVASYSSRGNVGIGTEGTFGRFKPDVVSPGTFVVSTRSSQWFTNGYFNPTNILESDYPDQIVESNDLSYYTVSVPPNAIAVAITLLTNNLSPYPFPTNLPIYASLNGYPTTSAYDIVATNQLDIPPDSGGAISGIQTLQGNGFSFAVGNTNNFPVNYDLVVDVFVTNSVGNEFQVLEGMDDQLAPYYRYESGTSMASADVSGVLALLEDYFTNSLSLTPSPALMKALLINGSRPTGDYTISVTNTINYEGWGLDDIQNCIPMGGLTPLANTATSDFFVDQNPTNALATGDSHTFIVTIDPTTYAQYLPLQATLVWTDPPGDPAAAIKLVNNLDIVVTNLDTTDPNYGSVYFGNDISPDTGFNEPWNTNGPPNLDVINNVKSILLPPYLGAQYSVTVVARAVNVNAVTAQTNNAVGQFAPNVVQDFALVISVGDAVDPNYGQVTNAFTVTDLGISSNPTGDQDITAIVTTNSPLVNQMAGASSPLMGTNTVPLGTNTIWGAGGIVTIGQTNQWHFYIVTNTGPQADFTNAAFITYDPSTLSIPRMGTLDSLGLPDATRPGADIDLFVSQDPNITNLSPVTISNALVGVAPGFGVGDAGTGLTQDGTQYVFFTNSAPGQVYYLGVQSEDREAAEYSILPVFTDIPFSSLDQNGNQIVRGLLLPTTTPLGSNAHPGTTNVFALAVIPMVVEKVTVTNLVQHQNFGDLFGSLSFSGQNAVLNNHDAFGNTFGHAPIVYDDSPDRPLGTTNSDGPGSLLNFRAQSALGPWILTELDDSADGKTGQVSELTLVIQPHRQLKFPGIIVSVPAMGWFIDYVDVPPGYTNLTFYATNNPPVVNPPLEMFEKLGEEPTTTDFDQEATLTNTPPGSAPYPNLNSIPGNTISIGPPLAAGRYFIGLYNPGPIAATNVYLAASLGINQSGATTYNYISSSTTPLANDAVTDGTTQPGAVIQVPLTVTQQIASVSVGIVVQAPRISDYTFTLVSPTGQRVLLMENRGGSDTNGAGLVFVYTNVLNSTATGGASANTNYLYIGPNPAGTSVPITWNFYTVPDEMTVYEGTNSSPPYLLYDTGLTNNPPAGPGGGAENTIPVTVNVAVPAGYTNITIIMNQFGNPDALNGDAWTYTAGAAVTNYEYLMFTDNTNQADIPIQFAPTPYNFAELSSNYVFSDFDYATNGDYRGPTNIYDQYGSWSVPTNVTMVSTLETNGQFAQFTNVVLLTNNFVSVVNDPSTALTGDTGGSNYLALAYGTISRAIPTVPGRQYNVTFWYRGPGIAGWWRGEGNGDDSSDPENDNNNGTLIGRFNFPAGEVGQAFEFEDPGNQFQFADTNTYIQVPASPSLNVGQGGGFTIEGWINPTNTSRPEPIFEWLAHVPTNTAVTNVVIVQGPVLDPATGHYYYLLGPNNWTTSELWAEELGGHLATVTTANLENWIYDTFTAYGTLNRDLWIGLGYTNNAQYGWSSGFTNLAYTNWAPGQPFMCGANNDETYVAIMGPTNAYPGLWQLEDNLGLTCDNPPTNPIYGVVEVPMIPTNGVQFWFSGTNWTGSTNYLQGALVANIVDTNYVSHWIFSPTGLITTNVFQHVALTFNTNSGIAALYLNGTNVATSNLYAGGVSFVPKTDGDLLIGWDMSLYTNNYFSGLMDEMSLYGRALSDAEINGIYSVSADTTNREVGKFDPTVTPATGLAEAQVTFGSSSSIIYGVNDQWLVNSYTFTATSNSMPLTITGLEPGILLDSFSLEEAPETNLYYLPEQTLDSLVGDSAGGDWTLQVWDNRTGADVPNLGQLVNWELSFVLASNALVAASLPPETPVNSTVTPGQFVYYSVTVPAWAHEATNILVSSSEPVNLFYYAPTNVPDGNNPVDIPMLLNQTSGSYVLMTNSPTFPLFPLVPGQTYYLGVQDLGPLPASVTLQVNYDILGLTNGVPYTSDLTNEYSSVHYFSYDVSSNAYAATFQLLQLNGNADLVLSDGLPLPTLTSSAIGSFSVTNDTESIYLLTNSTPVPLSPGRWYLGVFNRGPDDVNYTVLAKEIDFTNTSPTNAYSIINLTNGVPFNWTTGPGADLTNFFVFQATNQLVNGTNISVRGLRFELYNLTGNGDLTLQTNTVPLAPPFFSTSQNPGYAPELIIVETNNVQTNLNGSWYLGVPNNEITNINFTIIAEVETNSYFPAFPGAVGAGGGANGAGHAGVLSTVYHVTSLADSGMGTLRAGLGVTNRTIVFDVAGIILLQSPLVITNSYVTIAGQTSPGGITIAGNMTAVSGCHDIIVRYIRFRRGAADDSFQFLTASNVIADHISAEWTSDNLLSSVNSSNVTVQWSIMADNIYLTNFYGTNTLNDPDDVAEASTNISPVPDIGSLARQGSGFVSFYHNLYADNAGGALRLGDNLTVDFVNNVAYNWRLWPVWTGGTNDLVVSTNGCTNTLNFVANYFIAGPDTSVQDIDKDTDYTNIAYFGNITNAVAANWLFQTNNFIDSDTNGVLNGSDTGWEMFTNDYIPFAREFPTLPVPVDEAYIAYERTLDFAGVNMGQRDSVDTNIVTNVRYQNGRMITTTPLLVPGIVAWWKGESNYLDTVGGNNIDTIYYVGFEPGKVGTAFDFTNSANIMVANPAEPGSLDVGQGPGLTFEGWINPASVNGTNAQNLFDYESTFVLDSLGLPYSQSEGISFLIQPGGVLSANLLDTTGASHVLASPSNQIKANGTWQHVAVTYDQASGIGVLYVNGVPVTVGNVGSFTPQTSYPNFCIGGSAYNAQLVTGPFNTGPVNIFAGGMDELALYNTALSSNKIAAIYQAGQNGKFNPGFLAAQPYLDTDQDGIPDFWESTFTPTLLYTPSNNRNSSGDGYTDLEDYNNWLAAPHAVTTETNPVYVDLYQICGQSGRLAFYLTNNIQGTVYLTNVIGSVTNTSPWSNSIAVFTPTNNPGVGTNYFGFASFSFYVTNLDTSAYFGPQPVSVVVSPGPILTNVPIPIVTLTNGVPYDPCITNGTAPYLIYIPSNTPAAVFELEGVTGLTPGGTLGMAIGYGFQPSISTYDYYTNVVNSAGNLEIAVTTNSMPQPMTNGNWYISAIAENYGQPVCYTVLVSYTNTVQAPVFYFPTNTTVTNIIETVPWSVTCVATDLDTPPLPLTFAVVNGPQGLFVSNNVIYWTPAEGQGPSTNNVSVSVSNGDLAVTNTFTIIVEDSNLPPVLPTIPVQVVFPPNTLVVSNAAYNPNIPVTPLGYTLTTSVPGTNANQPTIDSNGTITWTPSLADAYQLYEFTTVVTDTNVYAINSQELSATNTFLVFVAPSLFIGQPGTNVVPANSTNWFAVLVPNNAIAATNRLLFATLPVDLLFSTNVPPTNSYELLANVTSGASVLTTNLATAPTNIVPGGLYFLGVGNPNSVAVTNALRVDFELAPSSLLSLPAIPTQYIAAGDTLVVTNTATDTNASATLVYDLIDPPAGATINSNGIITWPTSPTLPPTNVVITTSVTDVGANVTVENSFDVVVLPGLGGIGPVTNTVPPNGINWFLVHVPSRADMATNTLVFATGPVDLWYSTNVPPSITNLTDVEFLTNSLAGSRVITTTTVPPLVPGSRYFLGVQNPNNFTVTNAVDVEFHFLPAPVIFSIVQTNVAGSNGFLITWYAPTNNQFHLQWTHALVPPAWTNFNGVISFTSFIAGTNSQFQYFDDGSQTGGFGPTRFYRLLLLNSPTNTAPFFIYSPSLFFAPASVPFLYTNSAKDWDIPPQILAYSVSATLAHTNVTIDPFNGLISWTPDPSLVGMTNFITTVVTDNGVPPKSATNTFEVIVTSNSVSVVTIGSISVATNGMKFQWTAPANEQFQVRWTTNLANPNWQTFPNVITSPTINYSFVDTNMPLLVMKFYQLILLP